MGFVKKYGKNRAKLASSLLRKPKAGGEKSATGDDVKRAL
jgi:hypothetical protein